MNRKGAAMLCIAELLDPPTLATLRAALADPAHFVDGRATAAGQARAVKDNVQIPGGGRHAMLTKAVETALRNHDVFMIAARPKRFVRLLFSRYEAGQAYGRHLDAPLMEGMRTDLSFTLFLNDPDDYEGGELVIEERDGETDIKLEAGSIALYPSTALHRVEPVTRGTRLACVGWVRSFIRQETQRDILFDLDLAADALTGRPDLTEERTAIARARDNLIRLWAED